MNRHLLLALMALAACKSPQEKYEAAARVNLAAMPALYELASAAPPVDPASTQALASLKDLSAKYLDSNALIIHLEELQNPTLRREIPVRLNHRSPTVDLAAKLNLTKPEPDARLDASYALGLDSEDAQKSVFQRMGTLKYVLVVRTRGQHDAQVAGGNTFIGGAWEGEVLVFELASKHLLGGFALAGDNHGTVQTRDGRDTQNLAADLTLATRGNLNARLRQVLPAVGANDELN